jgi:hypothetical protein
LGSPDKLQVIPVSWAQRSPSIQSGDIDVIINVTGWTMTRDTELDLQYSRPYFIRVFCVNAENPDNFEILGDVLAQEPEGIVTRQGEDVINWMDNALLMADAMAPHAPQMGIIAWLKKHIFKTW